MIVVHESLVGPEQFFRKILQKAMGWMDGWMDGMDGWMDGMKGWMDGWLDGLRNGIG